MKHGIWLLCALSLAVVGCSTTQAPSTKPSNIPTINKSTPQAMWEQRQQVFARMKEWRMDGRVSLTLDQQNWSFSLDWLQRGNQAEMNIKNPLTGSTMAKIVDTGSRVTMTSSDGKTYQDTNAERLLQKQLGMRLPLSGMRYWARGIADPSLPLDRVEWDSFGRAKVLEQGGWVIKYARYVSDGSNALPDKIQVDRAADKMKVKVLAKDWKTTF